MDLIRHRISLSIALETNAAGVPVDKLPAEIKSQLKARGFQVWNPACGLSVAW